jgi:dienelactone hydrolase
VILRALAALTTATLLAGVSPAGAAVDDPAVGSPEYVARDTANIADAYGRITGPGGQLQNPAYLPALVTETNTLTVAQLLQQAANPNRPTLTPGAFFPGWNVGNPLRAGWNGTRGLSQPISFENRYGALLRGTVYRPKPGLVDPYTGERLKPPFPGVVITPGSVQGSEGMYVWLAQDLAERGYVVLTFDTQGQGNSETLPHEDGNALPFCNPFATPQDGEMSGCPGVPSQQLANFVYGTQDALDFFVSKANPYLAWFDQRKDKTPATKGRRTKIAVIGHSLGAGAISKVQATDKRIAAVVALDKLNSTGAGPTGGGVPNRPVAPALAIQSEYGFTVSPWWLSGESSLSPQPSPGGHDPMRERRTGFDDWAAADVDSMLIVPRASTHLEYTDIPLVLPASRYGQALTSVYTQAWLGRYLKHDTSAKALLAQQFRYLEPVGGGTWAPVTLRRDELLSFYYCSAYRLEKRRGVHASGDITGVGCSG